MPFPKQDIRITKTHKALVEALMTLCEKKPFQKITVNDICQTAMVSRSTFYLHFEDKYQLMQFSLQAEQERFRELFETVEDIRDRFRLFFKTTLERKTTYRFFIDGDVDNELKQMLQNFFHETMMQIIEDSREDGMELQGPISIIAAYHASGLAGMVIQWIHEDFRYSVEEMTLCLYNQITNFLPD